ncbi:deoxyribose-phosphate aldolase [Negadavirga shengliensis]|uniref:Deoxyribose-phosphate aldolase n=1 Tax=Negadavirga shengliensis TaxID=1389218 RepID=A0ABV9SW12_9BACT
MKNLHLYLEHTLLKADVSQAQIEELIQQAKIYQFRGLCVPPFWVKKVKRDLKESDTQVVTVIGFPFGNNLTESKLAECQHVIQNGADELDVVWSLTAFKSGMNWPKIELAKLAGYCHDHEKIMKVILETAYLSNDEILTACEICRDAGADFVKTSTGYASEGAKADTVRLMRSVLPSQVGIKASGGIKTLEQALEMIHAGADRIGTSSGHLIMEALKNQR